MVQAAMGIMRLKKARDRETARVGEKIAQRRGKRIATVALARRLAGVMWAMLRDGTQYQPGRQGLAVYPGTRWSTGQSELGGMRSLL